VILTLVKIVIIVVTTPVFDSVIFAYFGGSSQHVASLYTLMLLLQLIPDATRPSTDINNYNNNNNFVFEFNIIC